VIEEVYATAPDGQMVADVRFNGPWPWIAVVVGAAIIAVGGLLLSPRVQDQPPLGHQPTEASRSSPSAH
jgi:hypothetical protein